MKRFKKTIKYMSATVSLMGFVLMLGTAGASDLETIPFEQIFIQSMIGLGMFVAGFTAYWNLQGGDYCEGEMPDL